MSHERLPFELGPYRSVRFPLDVDAQVEALARELAVPGNGKRDTNYAEAIRVLVMQGLERRGGLSGLSGRLENTGYNAGVRQGLQEARAAIAAALNDVWREG